jgi:Holliday junction DNA helicase RuvA
MIGKLKGRIDSVTDDSVILDVGGVGYHVFMSTRTLASLPGTGEAAELIIETHVREDHIHLFGFPDAAERDCFRMLMTVQGVGVKMALAILGVFSPAQLATTIAAKDMKSLTRVSGVGNKLAERMVTELKNKVAGLPAGAAVVPIKGGKAMTLPAPTASEDAISALIHLGYSRAEAYNAVTIAASGLEEDDTKVDSLVRESLKRMAR